MASLHEEIQQCHAASNADLQSMRDERRRIEGELRRLVESIAVGNGSLAIMGAINDREARLRTITDKLIEPCPESFQQKYTRGWCRGRGVDIAVPASNSRSKSRRDSARA